MKKSFIFIVLALVMSTSFEAKSQWVQVWNGMGQTKSVVALHWNSSLLFAGLRYDGIYISTNEGLSWSVSSFNNEDVWNISSNMANYYAATDVGIYYSTNGITWTSFALTNRRVYVTALSNNYIFAGTDNYGVYISTNSGLNWAQSFLNNKDVWSLAIHSNNILAGTNDNGIYYSTDNGNIWNQSHLNNIDVECLKYYGTTVYAGTANGVYKSTNNGINWVHLGLLGKYVYDIVINEQYLYASTDDYGIYVATKEGITWNQINVGFPSGNFSVSSLVFTSNYLIAGSYSNSTWRRPLEQVGVNQISSVIPLSSKLYQNYPNPFNPTTTIKFDIPKTDNVKIKISDILGKEIATLVNEKLSPGSYSVDWNASQYPSGVYFYRMQSGSFTQTKQMLLIK